MPDDPNSESNDRGAIIVRTDVVGTVVFALTAIVAATTFASAVRAVAAAVALTLFFLGIAAFLWAFWNIRGTRRTGSIGNSPTGAN